MFLRLTPGILWPRFFPNKLFSQVQRLKSPFPESVQGRGVGGSAAAAGAALHDGNDKTKAAVGRLEVFGHRVQTGRPGK